MIKIRVPDCVLTIEDDKLTCNKQDLDFMFDDLRQEFENFGSHIPNTEIGYALFLLKELGEGVIIYSSWRLGDNPDSIQEVNQKKLI